MSKNVLIVVHQAHSTPGKIGRLLAQRGFCLERRCPCEGDALPADLSAYSAVIVFGGPQTVSEDCDGVRAELAWLERTVLPSGLPTLGICLGAQQLAQVLGAKVGKHKDDLVEIGYYEVKPTALGGAFLAQPTMFYQWHSQTFEIPRSAVHLAEADDFPGQAFCYNDHAYAIEFHPEMSFEMIQRWSGSEKGSPKLAWPGAKPRQTHLDGYWKYSAASDRWLTQFLDGHLLARAHTPQRKTSGA